MQIVFSGDFLTAEYFLREFRAVWYAKGILGCYLCTGRVLAWHVRGGRPNLCLRCTEELVPPDENLTV